MRDDVGGAGGALGSAAMLAATGGSLGTVGMIGAGLSLGTKLYGASQQKGQYEAQIEQEKAAHASRSVDQTKQLNDAISRQMVSSAAQGLGAGGSTFRQVSQSSFNDFHDDQTRDQLNLSFTESALRSKISATEVGAVGDIFSTAAFLGKGQFGSSAALDSSTKFKG